MQHLLKTQMQVPIETSQYTLVHDKSNVTQQNSVNNIQMNYPSEHFQPNFTKWHHALFPLTTHSNLLNKQFFDLQADNSRCNTNHLDTQEQLTYLFL